jgi:hypothetical protein
LALLGVLMPRKSRAKPGATRGGSKPDGPEPLRAVLACKATAGEQEAVRAAAKDAGMSESAWLRGAVQEALGLAQLRRAVEAARGEPTRADHARQVAAHLEVVGGMPSATA